MFRIALIECSEAIRIVLLMIACAVANVIAVAQSTPSTPLPTTEPAGAIAPKLVPRVVERVEVHGTPMATAPDVVALIEQKPGTVVDRESIRRSLRRLYATRLFETI